MSAAMKLPKRREPRTSDARDQAHAVGWNACLDAISKLPQGELSALPELSDAQIDELMKLAMPGTRPSACFRKFARLVAEQVICGLCNLPRTVCGCAPTDDGPGQQAAAPEVEIEKKGTEDANAK